MLVFTKFVLVVAYCLFGSGIPYLMVISKVLDGLIFSYTRALQACMINQTVKKMDRDSLYVRLGFYYEFSSLLLIFIALFDD